VLLILIISDDFLYCSLLKKRYCYHHCYLLRDLQQSIRVVRNGVPECISVAIMQKQLIDKDWFLQKLEVGGKSVRGLARHLEVDPSAVSRMLSGQRRMKMEEATSIALFLGASVAEVLSHAGVAVDLDGLPTQVLLAATINETGALERLKEPRPLPQSVIDRAQAAVSKIGNGKVLAAQVRAASGCFALWDDAVVLFNHTDHVENAAIGFLSICRSRDGGQILAKLERARKTGEARIMNANGKIIEVMLETATPVLAIIP
jgi:hypothetical protein